MIHNKNQTCLPSVSLPSGWDFAHKSLFFSSEGEHFLEALQPKQTTHMLNPTSTFANELYDFSTLSDDCPAAWAEFEGRKGVFIEGQVAPPLKGVQIVISSGGDKPIADITVETDSNGKYRLVCLYYFCE